MSSNENFFAGGGSLVPRLVAVEQQVSQFFAGEVAKEVSFPTWYTPPSIYVQKNGTILSKAAYPALWAAVSSSAITSAAYDAVVAASPIGACSQYADIDASTFKVPTVGQGGFSKAVGTNGFDIGTEDGGFGSQVENHKHVTPSLTTGGSFMYMMNNTNDNFWGRITYTGSGTRNRAAANETVTASNPSMLLTSPETYHNAGETTPQGVYNRVWIYTGNIVSNLPDPEPDWLAQQAVNTQAIAELNQENYLYVTRSGGGDSTVSDSVGFIADVQNGSMLGTTRFNNMKRGVYTISVRIGLSGNVPTGFRLLCFNSINSGTVHGLGGETLDVAVYTLGAVTGDYGVSMMCRVASDSADIEIGTHTISDAHVIAVETNIAKI